MSYASEDEVQGACRARMRRAMLAAIKVAQLDGPPIPMQFCGAANVGVVLGLADAMTTLIVGTSSVPDSTARLIADQILTGVARRTSAGRA